jgi:Kef-type K+ transport system membrane component KefB
MSEISHSLFVAYMLFDILLIVILARLLGNLLARWGQPRVVGEILAGLLLGPTLLGETLSQSLVPMAVRPTLNGVAVLGLIFFMFIAGLEFDLKLVQGRLRQATLLAVLSVAVPALLGFPIAAAMHTPQYAGPAGTAFLPYALLIGAALTVTAFPIMAHILLERGELQTTLGTLAVASAGIVSILMFLYIAFARSVATGGGLWEVLVTILLTIIFCTISWLLIRPWLARHLTWPLSANQLALILGGLLLYGLLADRIGIHALMGGFIWGVVMPVETTLRQHVAAKVQDVALLVFLPVFFASAGFSADLKLLSVATLPAMLLLLLGAVAGKFIAATPARLFGLTWSETTILGALFNTRGLLVLVVGLIGLQAEIITNVTFTLFVIVALVTNLMTLPIINAVTSPKPG